MSDAEERVAAHPPPERWLGFLLNRLGGAVRERTYATLRDLGLPPRALGLLLVLEEQPGCSQTYASARLGADRTTMSQLVDGLVRHGLIERSPDPTNRRSNSLALTSQGKRCVSEAAKRALKVEAEITAKLTAKQLDALKATLDELLRDMPD